MKYHVKCPSCGNEGDLELDFEPVCCMRCGSRAEVTAVKTQARLTAEAKMAELEEIAPRLAEARDAYFKVRVEYEDRLQFLAQYRKRKVITDEEFDRYRIKNQNLEKGLNRAVKEYREDKKRSSNERRNQN